MKHPETVIEKAKQLERLLQRVEAGEPFEQVRADLGLAIKLEDLPKLQSRYAAGGRRFEMLLDGRYGHWQTVNSTMRAWLYERKEQEKDLRAYQLADELEKRFGVRVAVGHINYLLRKRGLTHATGRPKKLPAQPQASPAPAEPASPSMENAGLFFPGSRSAGDAGSPSRRDPA